MIPTSSIDVAAQVSQAFAKAFKVPSVDRDADFFDLGGDSLIAEELAMLLTEIAGKEIRISSLFDLPTPAQMGAHLDGQIAVSNDQKSDRPPIFMVHGASGYTLPKQPFLDGLAPDQKLEFLQLPGLSGDQPMLDFIPAIADDYATQIEQSWPEGRLHIAAFCNGALIALGIAQELAKRGRTVDHMVLLDPGITRSIEFLHHGRKPRPTARFGYFILTGRFTGGASMKDLQDPKVRRFRGLNHFVGNKLRRFRAALTGHKAYRFRPGHNHWAHAKIHAANNHFWPSTYIGSVDIICTRERKKSLLSPDNFWRSTIPNANVMAVLDDHADVTGANGSLSAMTLQAAFDKSGGSKLDQTVNKAK